MKTNVIFLIEKGTINEVWAYFPDEIHADFNTPSGQHVTTYVCYSHIGQHSSCNQEYVSKCKRASARQYQDLKKELESIGYKLNILNKLAKATNGV